MKSLFCENCEKLISIFENINEKIYGKCPCGFKKEIHNLGVSEKINREERISNEIVKEEETPGFPHTCKKCGCEECDIYDLGCAYSDESNIYLYKCKKCKFVERQADGNSNL